MVGGGWLRLAVVSCGVSWEREKDDAEGWGRVFGNAHTPLGRRIFLVFCYLFASQQQPL